jgi:hypothetical protein
MEHDWIHRHEERDDERFADIDLRLRELPKEIKDQINGSVQVTVQTEMGRFFRWVGIGGFISLITFSVWLGAISNQQRVNTAKLDNALDQKDLILLQTQLTNLSASVAETNASVEQLKTLWNVK